MVERRAVNADVTGSNPVLGAKAFQEKFALTKAFFPTMVEENRARTCFAKWVKNIFVV